MSVEVEPATLTSVARALRGTSEDLDGACASIPGSPGTGEAAPLLADVLFVAASTTAHLAYEAHLLAERTDECEDAYSATDRTADARLTELFGPR